MAGDRERSHVESSPNRFRSQSSTTVGRRGVLKLLGAGAAATLSGTAAAAASESEDGDLYVAPDGDDGASGTKDEPFATVGRALEELNGSSDPSGTLVYVRGGSYEESEPVSVSASGTESAPIRLEAYPGEEPSIDLSAITVDSHEGSFQFDSCSHWKISGLEWHGSPSYGVMVSGDSTNLDIDGCTFHHNGHTGLYFLLGSGADEILVKDSESYMNSDDLDGDNADGFAVGQDDSDDAVTFHNCRAHHNVDDGFDLWGAHGATIQYCRSWENGFDLDGNRFGNSGNGFKLSGDQGATPYGGNTLLKSTAWDNAGMGVNCNDNNHPHTVYNVTSVGNAENYWLGVANDKIRNCISHDGEVSIAGNVDETHNSWNLGIENPSFDAESAEKTGVFALDDDSPCVDAGVDVGLEYDGPAPNLGAFE